MSVEGYVVFSYGPERYLRHAIASIITLRRHDPYRPIALYCCDNHRAILNRRGFDTLFDLVQPLPEAHQSVVGFKHQLHRFMPFDRNLFVDTDTVWCRNPDPLWQQLSAYDFTATGADRADFFFGGPKDLRVLLDFFFDRRGRTLRRFGLTHLPRIQSGVMFAQDYETTRLVCETAGWFKKQEHLTHFQSRLHETGRNEESCEWSLAMAMSKLHIPVVPWFQNYHSPQLDFIHSLTDYDPEFLEVSCRYPCDRFVYSLRGYPNERIRKALMRFFSRLPGRGDSINVTPFVLHFGWIHQKQPFYDFAERTWSRLVTRDAHLVPQDVPSSLSRVPVPAVG